MNNQVVAASQQTSNGWITSSARWSLRLADLAILTFTWLTAHVLRVGTIDADYLSSHRYYLIICAFGLAVYIMEAVDLDPHRSPWPLIGRYLIACMATLAIIAVVFYAVALAWTGGGTNLLGRGVLFPALAATALCGSALRWWLHRCMRQSLSATTAQHRWLVVGHSDDQGIAAFWSEVEKRSPHEVIHVWDPGSGSYRTGRQAEAAPTQEAVSLFTQSWAGIVLVEDLNLPDRQVEALMHARLAGTPIYTVAEFYEEMWEKVPVMHLNHRWFAITGGFGLLHEPIHRRIKRLGDILLALGLLMVTAPLQMLTAIIVRLVGGRGSVIYSQTRSGQNGIPFTIYKFRSMRHDAEVGGAQWAGAKDPRVFAFGGVMRKFRIDELPQFWNILKGDMSFIGPRPERPEFTADLESKIPFFSLRLLVKPGLTGWAQVNYPYGASVDDAREKLEYDLYYIKHQNVLLDVAIVMRTLRVVLRGFGGR